MKESAMITAEETVEEITGATKVEFTPSIDEKADAPKSMDVSVAAKTLAKRGKVKFLKGLVLGAVVSAITLPLGMIATGWIGETLAIALLK
jgi:hypothetical protein